MTDDSQLASEAPPPQDLAELWRQKVYPHIGRKLFMACLADKTAVVWDDVRIEVTALREIVAPEPSGPSRLPQTEDRLLKLARIGAESRHWDDNAHINRMDGHDGPPHECPHSDCVLVREAGGPSRLRALLKQWRAMVANAFAEGPIPGDETGHMSRWTAVEMCADELEALVGPVSVETKQQEETKDDHARVDGDTQAPLRQDLPQPATGDK